MLQAGRLSVNGQIAKPGDRVTGQENILLDGKLIRIGQHALKPKLLMYHKPVGEVCSRADLQGRTTVFSSLPGLGHGRWVGIGRLDINTSGLMLFTNQGELANRLMHPSFAVEREYAVRVHGHVTQDMIHRLQTGVVLDDGMAQFDQIIDSGGEGTNHWYHVILKEGRNREVRRLWESVGVEVSRLQRVRYDQFNLPKWLKPGKYRFFDEGVIRHLYQRLKIVPPKQQNKRHSGRHGKRSAKT